jgi:hypothetical protein
MQGLDTTRVWIADLAILDIPVRAKKWGTGNHLAPKTLRAGASKFQQTSAPLFGSALKRVSSST